MECETCGGAGWVVHRWTEPGPPIPSDCDGAGCPTEIECEDQERCPHCNGTGQQPEAPALAAPADLAAIIARLESALPCPQLTDDERDGIFAAIEQLQRQAALVDAETVKQERDALRGKVAKLRELAERPGDPCCLRLMRDMLTILDEVNNA